MVRHVKTNWPEPPCHASSRSRGAGWLTEGDHGPRNGCGRRGLPPRGAATGARGVRSPQASPAQKARETRPPPPPTQASRSGAGQSREKGARLPRQGNRGLSRAGSTLSRDSGGLLSALALPREAATGRLTVMLQWSLSCGGGSWFLWKTEASNFSLALNPDTDILLSPLAGGTRKHQPFA
ncbi:uncharacterized protein LOC129014049 [Pongo pygmaeus]|uniref:uncharacterized protein LOC129014049 n=1 Tax=Pongo pygmaeus TaxID=9600 RepID=UPI00300C1720